MTAERQAEYRAHETLRDAIREASNTQWARRIAEGKDEDGTLAETQPEVLGGCTPRWLTCDCTEGSGHDAGAVA